VVVAFFEQAALLADFGQRFVGIIEGLGGAVPFGLLLCGLRLGVGDFGEVVSRQCKVSQHRKGR
jgi:hypothetical protein